ncbi:MAG: efflux RND transporter permease subunit [Deltaproteobacteria bacterium]|nr:efflux RND transporter permease subunit [Deltaproteobacteria bacterium]
MKITETALKFRTTVYVLILFVIIAGLVSYKSMPLEANPEVDIPIMSVSTVYPGVSPEDMERLVTNVMERELKDLRDVKKMTSSSSESVSIVTIEFESGVDLDLAYQKVRDRADKAKRDLPADAEDPSIIEITLSEFPIMLVNISGKYELEKLKTVAEDVQEKIEQIPGVLGVDLAGGLDREIQIYLDPAKMEHHQVGVGQVIMRIQQEHRTTPAGSLTLGGSKYSVRIPGEYKDVKRMEDIVVKAPAGNPVRLKDLGRVIDGFEEVETISRIDGTESITLRVKKRAGDNIVRVADDVRALLVELEPNLPASTEYTVRQDQSEFIRDMVADLENGIITALILVLAVLLFSMGLRNAMFVAIAIPLSMLISFIILQAMGITLNMVVLFSLILALGMLVDNSIVVVENIYRHVSEGESRVKAALHATQEVAWPIIASTATTVMVFAPLMFWPGIIGDFMSYLPITVVTVLTSSLFVALVINPVIASTFLKPGGKKMFDDSGEATSPVVSLYQRILEWSLDRPKRVLAISGVVLLATVVLFGALGSGVEFFPQTTPERAQVLVTAPQGTVLTRTDALVKRVEELARKEDNVDNVIANTGMAGGGHFSVGGSPTHCAVIDIEFKDRHDRSGSTWDTVESLRSKLAELPGAEYQLKMEEGGPPTGAPVSVEVAGPEFDKLEEYAKKVKELIATVPGAVDITDNHEAGKPEIRIDVDREKAKLRKVDTQTISTAVRAAINGIEASVLREGDEEYDIVVRYDESFRSSINDILNIRVTGGDDVQIPIRDVAKVYTTGGFGSINHIDQKRTIAVTADVTERSSTEVMMDVEKVLSEKLELDAGYQLKFSGESEEQDKSAAFLGRAFGIGLMLMLMILITQFNSVQRPGIILGSVVMSMVGVLIGLMITQNKFGIIMTGLGVISLAGVVVNNAIVLIDYTDQIKKSLGISLREALAQAGVVRFRPVLLTAITTVLGLVPMAIGVSIDFKTMSVDVGAPTTEMWGPMAQAVSFGLIFATILTLVIVPVMYMNQENMNSWVKKNIFRIAPANEQAK